MYTFCTGLLFLLVMLVKYKESIREFLKPPTHDTATSLRILSKTYLSQNSISNLMEMCHLSSFKSSLYLTFTIFFLFLSSYQMQKTYRRQIYTLVIFVILWCAHLHERKMLMDINTKRTLVFMVCDGIRIVTAKKF